MSQRNSILNEKIALLKGGPGSERKISQASANSVAKALNQANISFVEIDVSDYKLNLPEEITFCYNLIHGTFGEDGQLQEILEKKNIKFSGANSKSSKIAFQKDLSKKIWKEQNISTPSYHIFNSNKSNAFDWKFPCVIKPFGEGSSVGVHIVFNSNDLKIALADEKKYGNEFLVEEYIEGREFTVGIVGDKILPSVEVIPESGFYDINNKYPWLSNKGKTRYECPAKLSKTESEELTKLAKTAHDALGIEVYSRVDVMKSRKNSKFYVLEINTIPGMTESSLLPKAAKAIGLSFMDLCIEIGNLSLLK